MGIYNRYIVTIGILLLLTAVILIGLGINSLKAYYTGFIMEALIVTELYRYLMPKARRGLNTVSIMLLCGFVLILIVQTIQILA